MVSINTFKPDRSQVSSLSSNDNSLQEDDEEEEKKESSSDRDKSLSFETDTDMQQVRTDESYQEAAMAYHRRRKKKVQKVKNVIKTQKLIANKDQIKVYE